MKYWKWKYSLHNENNLKKSSSDQDINIVMKFNEEYQKCCVLNEAIAQDAYGNKRPFQRIMSANQRQIQMTSQ